VGDKEPAEGQVDLASTGGPRCGKLQKQFELSKQPGREHPVEWLDNEARILEKAPYLKGAVMQVSQAADTPLRSGLAGHLGERRRLGGSTGCAGRCGQRIGSSRCEKRFWYCRYIQGATAACRRHDLRRSESRRRDGVARRSRHPCLRGVVPDSARPSRAMRVESEQEGD